MLISINPQHVENIFNGTKKYEYRNKQPAVKNELVIIENLVTT